MNLPPLLILSVALSAEDAKALSDYVVAAAEAARSEERESFQHITKIIIPTDAMEQEIVVHVRRAVKAERAACAKVCEDFDPGCSFRIRRVLAAAIRARGE